MYGGKLYGKMAGVGWEVKSSFRQRRSGNTAENLKTNPDKKAQQDKNTKRKVIWQDGREGVQWEVKGSARRRKSGGTGEGNQINIIIHHSLCHTHSFRPKYCGIFLEIFNCHIYCLYFDIIFV